MAEVERIRYVKELLRTRDALLSNISYHVVETHRNVHSDGSRPDELPGSSYTVKRLWRTHWMELDQSATHSGFKSTMNWDGKQARALTRFDGKRQASGVITDQENANFRDRAYNQILGFRVLEDGAAMTVAEWVAQYPKQATKVEAVIEHRDALSLLKVRVYNEYRQKTFWFDVNRGLTMVRTEYLYQPKTKTFYNKEFSEVLEAKEIDGIVVPTKVLRRAGSSVDTSKETEIVYLVTEVSIGSVKPADIEVAFPVNTRVIDDIKKVSYVVQSDGSQRPERFYDPQSGTLRTPASATPVKILTADSYKIPERVISPEERRDAAPAATIVESKTGKTLFWTGAGACVLLVVALLTVFRKRKMVR